MRAASDLIGFVGLEAVQGELVLLGPHGHGLQAQLVGGPEDTDGYFRTVGDEDFGNRQDGGS